MLQGKKAYMYLKNKTKWYRIVTKRCAWNFVLCLCFKYNMTKALGGYFGMEIIKTGVAGTMESSDIIVTIEPKDTAGVEVTLESDVMQQFGKQIRKVILDTLSELGVERAYVNAVDKGSLDCTVAARTMAAAYRAAGSTDYVWNGGTSK